MAHFSYAQLEGLWLRAGGPRALAPVMAAIAEAESSGNSDARNPSGASGLWQILGNPFPGDPFDPLTNAKMAVSKYRSQGLGAWVTYTSGAYKRFLRGGVPAAGGHTGITPGPAGSGGPGIGGVVGSISNALTLPDDVVHFFTSAGAAIDWLIVPSHWVRIFAGALGIGWTVGGIYLLGHAGGDAGGSGLPYVPRPAALPMGVFLVGAGGVLLFIAFHNLPKNVDSLPALLGYLQSQVKTGGTQPGAAAAAADVSTGPMATSGEV